MKTNEILGAIGLAGLAILGALGQAEAEKREEREALGILPIDSWALRRIDEAGGRAKIIIKNNNRASYIKRGSFIDWDIDYKFQPRLGCPEFINIEIEDYIRPNHTVQAVMITKTGLRLSGKIMIVRG